MEIVQEATMNPLMKRPITALAVRSVFLVVFGVTNARALMTETNLTVSQGYRVDNLNWNVAGDANGQNPNIQSELTHKDLKIYQLAGELKSTVAGVLYTRTNFDYGWILSGDSQDSDYAMDNRGLEFSRSNSKTCGNVWDASVGLGYPFQFKSAGFQASPLVGYAYNKQNLDVTDGNQTANLINPSNVGPFPGLDTTYKTQWWGPWLGIDLTYKPIPRLQLNGGLEYHWVDYRAVGNWNLRGDLQHPESLVHTASGAGLIGSIGGNWSLSKNWLIDLQTKITSFSTRPGVSTQFGNTRTGVTQLNEVNWSSLSVSLGMGYRFQ
jgi:hypothetical protein